MTSHQMDHTLVVFI